MPACTHKYIEHLTDFAYGHSYVYKCLLSLSSFWLFFSLQTCIQSCSSNTLLQSMSRLVPSACSEGGGIGSAFLRLSSRTSRRIIYRGYFAVFDGIIFLIYILLFLQRWLLCRLLPFVGLICCVSKRGFLHRS